ncbi:MAG: MgtC/SapB family protein [Bacteroidales bacterium]|nr:MgtC/SapB family protein [Bacteroidales bacterium]
MPITTFIFRLACALIAGIVIGTQRELKQRQAGLTTNSLVAVGACLFILLSESVIMHATATGGPVNNDNLRVLSQVVTGIGFLGAGVIMKDGLTIHGLSSAATIWCSAAVGCICGYGFWCEALIAVAVVIGINWGLKGIEPFIKKRFGKGDDKE